MAPIDPALVILHCGIVPFKGPEVKVGFTRFNLGNHAHIAFTDNFSM